MTSCQKRDKGWDRKLNAPVCLGKPKPKKRAWRVTTKNIKSIKMTNRFHTARKQFNSATLGSKAITFPPMQAQIGPG